MTNTKQPRKHLSKAKSPMSAMKATTVRGLNKSSHAHSEQLSSEGETSSPVHLNEEEIAEQKMQKQRERKARNQRRYYENHKEAEREKARQRSAKNRVLSNQMWFPTSDDEYISVDTDMPTPSLVPVFDHTFTPITAVSSPSLITATLQHNTRPINLMPPSASHGYTMPCENRAQPLEFFDVDGHFDSVEFREWRLWTAPRRIAAMRRWIIHAASKYGPVEHWGEAFSLEWCEMKDGDASEVRGLLERAKRRIKLGRIALNYLEQAMEGELSANVEEWRDLYAQSHQLACQLWTAVLGVQYRLDCAVSGATI